MCSVVRSLAKADRVCEFFWHLPYGRLNAEWQHAKDEEFISQAFAKPFLEAFIGQATVEAGWSKLHEGSRHVAECSLLFPSDRIEVDSVPATFLARPHDL